MGEPIHENASSAVQASSPPARPALEEPSLPSAEQLGRWLRQNRLLVGASLISLILHAGVFMLGNASRRAAAPPSPALSVRLATQAETPDRTARAVPKILQAPGANHVLPPLNVKELEPAPPVEAPAKAPSADKPQTTAATEIQVLPASTALFSWWQFADPNLGYFGPNELDILAAPLEPERFLQPLIERLTTASGRVVVRVYINESGTVDRAEIQEADPPGLFEEAVLRELYQSVFTPAMKEGRLVKSRKDLEIVLGPATPQADTPAERRLEP